MKSSAQIQHFKKCVILFMVGIVCSALAYAIHVVNPTRAIIDYKMAMTPTSFAFTLWKKPPIDIFLDVYIFNITNPDEFLAGKGKLKLKELGPYVFKEVMENTDVTWNENDTLSYRPKREVFFVPERSVGDPWKDVVRVPNIPLLGVASALHDSSPLVTFPLTHAINLADSQSILNVTVHEYLWGYDDTLVNIASILVPNFIDFKKFGLLDRMYDEGDNIMTMNIRRNKNMTDEVGRYLSIDTMNGSPGLSEWGYEHPEQNETKLGNTICNRIQGSTEGVLFPMDLDKHAVFRVFRKAFCRPISISYQGEAQADSGLWGYSYDFTDGALDMTRNTTENECYCRKMEKCLKKGLSDLTPCYYNIPAAMSRPHFLNSDPSLVEAVEGLKPDAEKHGNKIIIQPDAGIPLQVNSRIQTNLVMKTVEFCDRISPFNDLVIPIFWTDLNIPTLSDDILFLLKMGFQIGPIVQTVLISLLAIGGVMAIAWALLGTVWLVQQQDTEENKPDESNDLKIPLGYGQYSTIRILPAIKKITSKTDLFS